MQKTYTINGMTCEHCVKAITEEVSAIDGVSDVQVSLASGSMDVSSESPIEFARIEAAVDEAGDYTVGQATSLDTAGHPGGECGCGGHGHHGESQDAAESGCGCGCGGHQETADAAGAESGCGCGGHEGHHHSGEAAEKHASHAEGESCGCGSHQAESGCGCGDHEGHHHSGEAAEKHASHAEGESCGCGGHHHHQTGEANSHVFAADGTQDADAEHVEHKGFLGRLLHH